MGRDVKPTLKTWERFNPNPRRTTAYCNTFFDVNCIPIINLSWFISRLANKSPIKSPMTGPPIIGNKFPRYQAMSDISIEILIPGKNSFIFIKSSPKKLAIL